MAVLVQGNTREYASVAYATGGVIKASPGRLFKAFGYHSGVGAQFLQFHDAAAVPADTAVPKMVIRAGITSNLELDLHDLGWQFVNGIVWCLSSTAETKTLVVAAATWLSVIYK
jgi:hypothetical protein